MSMVKSPIIINQMQLKNRLVMPPMATSKSDDGRVSQALLDYYQEKSAGGYLGLIITEHSYVTMAGKASAGQVSIADDSDVAGLKKLVAVVHGNDSKIIAQISHAGSATNSEITGKDVLSASAVINTGMTSRNTETPTAMSKAQIAEVVEAFAAAARRAKEAGYDGVEIHSAHGYLLNQFYSPLTNHRKDEYGGTLENRLRIHKEVIQAVRAVVGKDYPVALRLGGCDYTEGGSTIEDSVNAAVLLESYGIDLLDISGGLIGYVRADHQEPGYFSDMTTAIKKKVQIPVILTGGVDSLAAAEALLKAEAGDLIGIGRALYKDSLWAHKAFHQE